MNDMKGQVLDYILETLESKKLHMTLIDPDKQEPERGAEIAKTAEDMGSDAIMIGGSTGVTQEKMDRTIQLIKERVKLPVIIFPTTAKVISSYADAIYFMSLLNSRNTRLIVGEQVRGAPYVKRIGLEPIPMGYVVVEPGMKVGEVGEADVLKRDDISTAVGYALTTQYLGMRLLYLEAGSGAPEPVPPLMISAVKSEIDIPLIIGGGIRTAEACKKVVDAGADVVVTGTVVEESDDLGVLKGIISAVKESRNR